MVTGAGALAAEVTVRAWREDGAKEGGSTRNLGIEEQEIPEHGSGGRCGMGR